MFQLIIQNPYLLFLFAFLWMLFSNIFPIMFFLFPEIIITSSIYLANETKISIYLVFVFCFIWAIIWETISFFIWKKIKIDYIYRFFKKENVDKLKEVFLKHHKKSIIIGKMMPWITWLVPVFFWLIHYNFKKFFLINSLMIFYSLASFFITIVLWFSIFDLYFKEYKIYLFWVLILFFLFFPIYKKFKK